MQQLWLGFGRRRSRSPLRSTRGNTPEQSTQQVGAGDHPLFTPPEQNQIEIDDVIFQVQRFDAQLVEDRAEWPRRFLNDQRAVAEGVRVARPFVEQGGAKKSVAVEREPRRPPRGR